MALRTLGWASDERDPRRHRHAVPGRGGARARRAACSRCRSTAQAALPRRGLARIEQPSQSQDHVIDWLPDDAEARADPLLAARRARRERRARRRRDGRTATSSCPRSSGVRRLVRGSPRAACARARGPASGTRRGSCTARASADGAFEKLVDLRSVREATASRSRGSTADPNQLYVHAPTANERIGPLRVRSRGARARPARLRGSRVDVGRARALAAHAASLLGVEVARDAARASTSSTTRPAREQAAIDRAFPGTTNRIVSLDREEKIAIVAVSGDTKPPEYYVSTARRSRWTSCSRPIPSSTRSAARADEAGAVHGARRARDPRPISRCRARARHEAAHDRDAARRPDRARRLGLGRHRAVPREPRLRGVPAELPRIDGLRRELRAQGHAAVGPRDAGRHQRRRRVARGQGIADPDRIGIYGVGYGGYAALEGLVKTPELYRAGASFAGSTRSDRAGSTRRRATTQSSDFNNAAIGDAVGRSRGSSRRPRPRATPPGSARPC